MSKHSQTEPTLHACFRMLMQTLVPAEQVTHNLQELDSASQPVDSLVELERRAKTFNIKVEVVEQHLASINAEELPVILALTDGSYCVLNRIDHASQQVTVWQAQQQRSIEMTFDKLQKLYAGQCLFLSYQGSAESYDTLAQRPSRHWFWAPFWQAWPHYWQIILASILINLFVLAVPIFIRVVYDRVIPGEALTTLWALALGVSIVLIFDFILKLLRSYFIDQVGERIDRRLSSKLFNQAMHIKMAYRPQSVGALASNLQSYEFIRNFMTSSTISLMIDLPFILLFIGVIYLLGGLLAIVPLTAVVLIGLIVAAVQIPIRRISPEIYHQSAQKQGLLVESLESIERVKTACAEQQLLQRWDHMVQASAEANNHARFYGNIVVYSSYFIQQATLVGMIILGVYMIMNNNLTLGALIASIILVGRALSPLTQIASLLGRYHHFKTALEALSQLMGLPSEKPKSTQLKRSSLNGKIDFEDVTFYYQSEAPGSPVLSQLNCTIQAGERVGIIGGNEAGKSTFLRLLLGLYDLNAGSILVDDLDLRQINPRDLRQNIGYMPQEIQLFQGTLRHNLQVANPFITDSELIEVIQGLGLNKWLNRDPQGLDRQIGEHGHQLSGGQRQLISLAQVMIQKPNILLLDEPTYFMDQQYEDRVKAYLHRYAQNKTMLIVSHKTSILALVDRIIVLDQGQIKMDAERDQVINAIQSGKIRFNG